MAIDPCPDSPRYAGSERIDAYVCTCTSGHWRCVDCYEGASLCVESPDGSLYFDRGADGGSDAGSDARPDAEAGPDVEAGADGYADADKDAAPQADATVDASSSD
jgi:hypothetical protein